MAHVGSHVTGAGETHLGVHIGTVHIDESTHAVDDVDDVEDALFESTVGRRIGNHQAAEGVFVLLGFGLQVVDVDITLVVALYDHHRHTGLGGGSGVGAMGRGGDEADVALTLTVGNVIVADDGEAAVFAIGTRVRLQRATGETSDDGKLALDVLDHLKVTLGLVGGDEGVHAGKLAPAEGHHLGGGIELHGAASQRNHGAVEAEVFLLEHLDVAHHGGLVVERVENLLGEVGGGALEVGGDSLVGELAAAALALDGGGFLAGSFGQAGHNGVEVGLRGGLVDGDANALVADIAEVNLVLQSHFAHLGGGNRALEGEGVEVDAVVLLVAVLLQLHSQAVGTGADAGGNLFNAFGTVPDGVETAHVGHEGGRGADIRGGFVAFDVLFTHTEGHAEGGVALGIDAPADDAAGEESLEGIGEGEEAGVGTAEAHGQTEALGVTHGAVGTHLAGSLHQGQRHEVGGHADEDTLLVALGDEARPILCLAELVGILHEGGEVAAVELSLGGFASDDLNATGSGIGLHHGQGLGQDALVDEHLADTVLDGLTRTAVEEHNHGLAGGGGLVEQTGVAQRHAGHAGNHGLIVHQGLQTSLADFGLVGSVARVPTRVLKDIAHDDGRGDGAVVAHADVALVELVLLGQRAYMVQELILAHAFRQGHRLLETDGGGDSFLDKLVHRTHTDGLKHLFRFGLVGDAVVT